MQKFNKKILVPSFLLIFAAQIILPAIFKPQPVSAAETVQSLQSKVQHIQKLRGLANCVDKSLATSGIGKDSGPWTVRFVAGRAINAVDANVGHGVDSGDGKWDCGSASGDRENTWFKLILKNGSDKDFYTGWSSGGDAYKAVASNNLADRGGYLYFINRDNNANHSGGGQLTEGPAKGKLKDQIGRTIAVLERGLTQDEKNAMAYLNLSYTFFDANACEAKETDANSGGDHLKVGEKTYKVGNKGGKNSVGFGVYGDNGQGVADGNLTCEQIASRMNSLLSSYQKVSGDDSVAPPGSNRADGSPDGSGTQDIEDQCTISANPITWIMCALITGFSEGIDLLDKEVTNLLNVRSGDYFGTDSTGQSFNEMWVSVRTIALGFLIIVALIMIISTAIGVGPFDAYTVKKIMPRLVIVIILIPLSWAIVIFMIDMASVLGFGIRGLIQAPFTGAGPVKIDSFQTTAGAVALAGAGLALGLPGLLSFLVGGFLAVMIAIVFLVLRQIFIVLFAVLAPIALVAFILPNTQKAWRFWLEGFTKALLVFPIITAFIAVGRIFAVVATTGNDSVVAGFIGFVAYFAPYFLIPTAFKMAGGLLGNITGMVNDRSRGAFDRLRKFRQGQMSKNASKIQDGTRFNNNRAVGKAANKYLETAAIIGTGKAGAMPTRWAANAAAVNSAQTLHHADELLEKDPDIAAIKNDDHMLTAFKTATNRQQIREQLLASGRHGEAGSKTLDRAVAAVERAQRVANPEVRQQVAAVGLAATGTGVQTHADMYQAAIDASGGDPSVRNAVFAKMRAASERVGNYSLSGPGHAESVDALETLERAKGSTPEQMEAIRDEINEQQLMKAMEVQGAGKMLQGKPTDVKYLTGQLHKSYEKALAEGTPEGLDKALTFAAQMKSLRDQDGGASSQATQYVNDMLKLSGVNEGAVNPVTGAALSVDEQFGGQIKEMMGAPLMMEVSQKYGKQIMETHSQRVTQINAQRTGGKNPTPPLTESEKNKMLQDMYNETAVNVITQRLRTRAGSYDVGGGNRSMPEELRRQPGYDPDNS